ncbi:MAG: prepilin peptidase, partial [Helicobacter sp.]|nr:prepilin peptidase [Helicobacter sp.]
IICFFLCLFFYTLCVIDWYFLEIPNILSFLTLGLGICYGTYVNSNAFYSPINPFLNAFFLMGVASFLRLFIGSIYNKEVMGEGDVIIFGILGSSLGIFYAFVGIFIAATTTLCVMLITKTYKMPFVPFLFFGFLSLLITNTLYPLE